MSTVKDGDAVTPMLPQVQESEAQHVHRYGLRMAKTSKNGLNLSQSCETASKGLLGLRLGVLVSLSTAIHSDVRA